MFYDIGHNKKLFLYSENDNNLRIFEKNELHN